MAEGQVVLQEPFMLVARGVATEPVTTVGQPYLRIGKHWMRFRSPNDQEFTLYRDKPEDLPEIELGAVHWVRVLESTRG